MKSEEDLCKLLFEKNFPELTRSPELVAMLYSACFSPNSFIAPLIHTLNLYYTNTLHLLSSLAPINLQETVTPDTIMSFLHYTKDASFITNTTTDPVYFSCCRLVPDFSYTCSAPGKWIIFSYPTNLLQLLFSAPSDLNSADLLKAIGSSVRCEIIHFLSAHPNSSPQEINRAISSVSSLGTLQSLLDALLDTQIITRKTSHKPCLYCVNPASVSSIAYFLLGLINQEEDPADSVDTPDASL